MLRWRSDLNKAVITSNFEARGWKTADHDDDEQGWDIYWASTASVQQLFAPNSHIKLRPGQLLSHFPNHMELTHKDLLVKNINRYRRRMRKAGAPVPDLIPPTFVLPQDYSLFVEEFKKQPGSTTFILKPARKAQGKGIYLINKLSQIKQQLPGGGSSSAKAGVPPVFLPSGRSASGNGRQWSAASAASTEARPDMDYVVSRYINNPLLLLGGTKFDLRLYVLVPSFDPLVVYLSSLGFARFTNTRYNHSLAELDNLFVHLTNVAVQKEGGAAYNSSHGNKWPLQDLRLHLAATHGEAATAKLFSDIQALVLHTLKAVQPVIINDKHCFELYGFDVLLDDSLQPWLIEVNASPSMTTTTQADRLMKWQVVHDTLSIIVPPAPSPGCADSQPASPMQHHHSSSSGSRHASASPSKATRHGRKKAASQQLSEQRPYPAAVGCMQLIHQDPPPTPNRRRSGQHHSTAAAADAADAVGAGKQRHVFLHG